MGNRCVPLVLMCGLWLLAGCASSETRSLVSKNDLPANGYRRIVVFVEGPASNPSESMPSVQKGDGYIVFRTRLGPAPPNGPEIEQRMLSALQKAGVAAASGVGLFKGRDLSEQAKAHLVQRDFDAVLYINIENGTEEEPVAASHNGQVVTFATGVVTPVDQLVGRYSLKPDGSVYYLNPVLKSKSDLQDTKTAKQVWTAETITTGSLLVLVAQTSNQIVEKMRADGVI